MRFGIDYPTPISDRISPLLEDADHLLTDISSLVRDVNKREGIEAIVHLADVPGDLERAEALMRNVYSALELAQQDATKGGD